MKRITITIDDEKAEFLQDMSFQLGLPRSMLLELLIDIIMGNFTIEMIKQHYVNEFSRKKNGS